MEKTAFVKDNPRLGDLHLKFAGRSWSDTLYFVRRYMEKSRDKTQPCEPIVRVMEKLQGELSASSMNTTKSQLEVIAKQQGMGFHITETAYYLTADLFYLEVFFQPCGRVEEVKVATHGKSPSPSESFLQLLRSENFADFSEILGRLFAQYSIPGNNKVKLLASLQYLMKDLQQLANIQRNPKYSDSQIEMINNGLVGFLMSEREDFPLTIKFYMPPNDGTKTSNPAQAAQITVGTCNTTHKLQMASMFPNPPQLDPLGYPTGLDDVPHELLPACFLLTLQPPLPMMSSFVKKLNDITDVLIPDADLQWAPLPKLLIRGSQCAGSNWESLDGKETIFTVPLPGGMKHTYVFSDGLWSGPGHRGTMMDSVPFTSPAKVPSILDLLRQQCLLNTLLQSCFASPCPTADSSYCDQHFEVLPESESSFTVTFHHPNTDSFYVLMVNTCNTHDITCKLFGLETCDTSIDEYITTLMKSCLSVPSTMRELCSKIEKIPSENERLQP
ncbi:mediator of RNA polymerase II transcription subunit 1-like isoform X2 [Gouania willdenowi]|uniref:mediator of RNA polymerase II transcription subunit 1-like isoform X2 n=1 Tax=Gouania willdenowi TaxID=441366 RepID=UPI001054F837|nr:mediator of RNA polymerase II transcription subunit 1-like isoform X2 [Gouania willdenowi]XP_028290593.1 mediator of RNA polymerase II transcription subunit 1-like isoform X2 [Gouania willdenowi]